MPIVEHYTFLNHVGLMAKLAAARHAVVAPIVRIRPFVKHFSARASASERLSTQALRRYAPIDMSSWSCMLASCSRGESLDRVESNT